jgi:hypothetical protein
VGGWACAQVGQSFVGGGVGRMPNGKQDVVLQNFACELAGRVCQRVPVPAYASSDEQGCAQLAQASMRLRSYQAKALGQA